MDLHLLEIIYVICAVFSVMVVTTFSFLVTCELMSFCGYGICASNIEENDPQSIPKNRKILMFKNMKEASSVVSV